MCLLSPCTLPGLGLTDGAPCMAETMLPCLHPCLCCCLHPSSCPPLLSMASREQVLVQVPLPLERYRFVQSLVPALAVSHAAASSWECGPQSIGGDARGRFRFQWSLHFVFLYPSASWQYPCELFQLPLAKSSSVLVRRMLAAGHRPRALPIGISQSELTEHSSPGLRRGEGNSQPHDCDCSFWCCFSSALSIPAQHAGADRWSTAARGPLSGKGGHSSIFSQFMLFQPHKKLFSPRMN